LESATPRLPAGLQLERPLGAGRRSEVWAVRYRGEPAALKLYRDAFVEKYRNRYGIDIAVFEFARNQAVRAVPGLAPYAARPLAVIGRDDGCSPGFVQERIDGVPLPAFARRAGGLPDSVLEAGAFIVRRAEAAGLHDLDLYYENILLRERDGRWLPVLHDFNLLPQHLYPPNPFLAFAYRVGLRRKSHRDYRCIRQWRAFSAACAAGAGP
jgi:hypothetical protein